MKPRDQRALILGLAVLGCSVLALRVAPAAWRTMRNLRETLSAQSELLARTETELRQADTLETSAATVRGKVVALAPKLLGAAREAEAQADVASRVKRVAAASRVRVERTTTIGDSTRAGQLRRVSLRMALEGDTRGTLALLGALGAGDPVLIPTNLVITATNPEAAAGPEVLRTEMTVQGWYLVREAGR